MKGCKFIIYSLSKLDQQTYTPLIEITPSEEDEDTTQPIVLTFN